MSNRTGFIFASLRTPPWLLWLGLALLALAACSAAQPVTPTPTPHSPPPSPTSPAAGDAATVLRNLILAERNAAITGDAAALAALWAADAVIVDGRGTPDPADDYAWRGRTAILDRYRLAVFPAPPPPLAPTDLAAADVTVSGATAIVRYGGDTWRMMQVDGRWLLTELRYNLISASFLSQK